MSQPLMAVDAALQALAAANTVDELIELANKAETLRTYARRAKLGMAAQNRCAELRLRAERKLGEFLTTTPRLHGRPKSVSRENTLPSLSDLGICDRKLSHRAQQLEAIPKPDFEPWLQATLIPPHSALRLGDLRHSTSNDEIDAIEAF